MTVLDEIDARPGSTVSLLRTFVGLYLRELGGWISTRHLVTLMGDAGVAPQAVRNGIARLKQRGLLLADPLQTDAESKRSVAGYRLNPAAHAMLERGDRRIFEVRSMHPGDPWCLISFTVEEQRRDVRHQLRRRLQWIGCGTVAPGLWICPAHLTDEVLVIAQALGVDAVVFQAVDPRFAMPTRTVEEAAASWWDLDSLASAHETFLRDTERLAHAHAVPKLAEHASEVPARSELATEATVQAFADYLTLVDRWRPLPYIDPGLPSQLLPGDWPGERSAKRFFELEQALRDPAREHVRAVVQ